MLTAALITLACCTAAIAIGLACTGADCLSCGDECRICSQYATDCTFTTETGTADLSVPTVVDITASNTIVTVDQLAASGTVEVTAEASFTPFNVNDVARLHIKYQDSDNSWYAEALTGPSGYVKLYERVSGTSTQRGSTYSIALADGDTHTLKICYANGGVVVKINDLSAVNYATTTGNTVQGIAVATGSITSLVEFVNVEYVYGYNASTKPNCPSTCWPYCTILCDLELTMSGWTNVGQDGATDCGSQCLQLNSIVHLDFTEDSVYDGYCASGGYSTGLHGCYWKAAVAFSCGGTSKATFFAFFGTSTGTGLSGTRLIVTVCQDDGVACTGFFKEFITSSTVSEATFDCGTGYGLVSNMYSGSSLCGSQSGCNRAGVTASITGANL